MEMLNRIHKLFSEKNKNILSVFFTAGYPQLADTCNIILELDKAGVDMIETIETRAMWSRFGL